MINKIYFNKQTRIKIKEILELESSIQLQEFLENASYKILLENIKKLELEKNYKPELYSNSSIKYNIKDLNNFLEELMGKRVRSSRLFCFKHKDYTIINDNINEEEGFTIILELTEKWNKKYGGYTSFVKNNEEIFRLNPKKNSLTIIKTNIEMKSFVKYINNKAKNKKRYFLKINF